MAPGLYYCLEWGGRMGRHYCHHCKIGNVSGGADTRQSELITATACTLSHQLTITYHTSASQMSPCLVNVIVKAQIWRQNY